MEAWQNEKHHSKGNNKSENPIKEFQTSRPCEVRRSGQVRSGHNICCLCSFLSLSFQAVLLLTKTAINHRVFFLVKSEMMNGWRNSNDFELRSFYFTTV